jgi:hypothetical protein
VIHLLDEVASEKSQDGDEDVRDNEAAKYAPVARVGRT